VTLFSLNEMLLLRRCKQMAVKAKRVIKTQRRLQKLIVDLIDLYMLYNPFDIYGFRFETQNRILQVFEVMHNAAADGELLLRVDLNRAMGEDYIGEQIQDSLVHKYSRAGWKVENTDGYDNFDNYQIQFTRNPTRVSRI
jgi:hypothetical protein